MQTKIIDRPDQYSSVDDTSVLGLFTMPGADVQSCSQKVTIITCFTSSRDPKPVPREILLLAFKYTVPEIVA
jgi:hypothetical protein